MQSNEDMVRNFLVMMNQPLGFIPEWPKEEVVNLHKKLIRDEFNEVMEVLDGPRINNESLVQLACELADLMFVTYGAALTMGIDLDEVFAFVAQNNLTKVTGPVLPDGKRGKSANHIDPADVVRHLPQFAYVFTPYDDE